MELDTPETSNLCGNTRIQDFCGHASCLKTFEYLKDVFFIIGACRLHIRKDMGPLTSGLTHTTGRERHRAGLVDRWSDVVGGI